MLSECAISGLIPLTSRLGVLESKLQLGVFLDSKQGVWALVFLHFSQRPGAPSPQPPEEGHKPQTLPAPMAPGKFL